jgi:hypothetical protein
VATDLALDGVELTRLLRKTGNYTIVVHTPIEHRFRYDLSVTDLGLRRDLSEISIGAPPQQGEVDRKDPADPQFFGSYDPVEFTAEAGDVLRISANTNDPAHLWILNDTDAVLDTTTEDRTGGIDEDPAAPPGVGSPPGLTSSTNPVLVHRFEESGQFEVIVGPDPPLNAEVNLNANLRLENSTIVSSKQEDEFRYTLSVDYAYSGQDVGEIPSTGTDQRLGQIYANQTWHARLDAGDPSSQRFGGTYEIIRYNAMVQERIEFTHRSPGNNPRIYLLSPRQLGRNQPREIIRKTTGRDEATFEHTFEQTDTYYIVVSSASGTGSSFALEAERKLEGRPITTVRLKPNRAQSTVGNVTTFDVVVFGLDQAPDEEGEDAGEGINGTALELNLGQPRTGTITRIDPAGNPADSSINLTNAGQRLVFNTSGQYWDGGPGGALGLFEGGFFDYNDYSVVDEQSDFQREAELTVNAVPVAQVRVTGVRQRPGGVAVALGAEKVLSAADADGTPFDGLEPDGYPLAVPSDSSFYRVFNPPSGPAPVAGSPPKDPDGDGKYEDVNGDGSVDERDVNLLYRVGIVGQGSPDTVRRFPISYDFNNDDEFGISDVQALLQEVRNP